MKKINLIKNQMKFSKLQRRNIFKVEFYNMTKQLRKYIKVVK